MLLSLPWPNRFFFAPCESLAAKECGGTNHFYPNTAIWMPSIIKSICFSCQWHTPCHCCRPSETTNTLSKTLKGKAFCYCKKGVQKNNNSACASFPMKVSKSGTRFTVRSVNFITHRAQKASFVGKLNGIDNGWRQIVGVGCICWLRFEREHT